MGAGVRVVSARECLRGDQCKSTSAPQFRKGNVCRACESHERGERARAARAEPTPESVQGLDPWATSIEREVIAALCTHGSVASAAEALGMTVRLLRGHLQEVERRAAAQGYSPNNDMTKTVPEGFRIKGVSTYYDKNGNVRGQWVKSKSDEQAREEKLLDALASILEPLKGAVDPAPAPTHRNDELLAVYPMGDPHIGMHAWAKETGGHDFDLAIAERNLCAAVDHLVALAPPAKHALLIDLGDFFHADNLQGVTARSGHRLDVDTRLPKVHRVGIRILRYLIDKLLTKHELVTVICEVGNHDDMTSQMLALALEALYEREPRVTVDTSPAVYHYYRFGACLIGTTHGLVKKEKLGGIMATDRAREWGETLYRMWYTGHVHHDSVIELPGCKVESFRTLAPPDAYATAAGYRSGQDMKLDVWHARHGLVNRHVVGIRQVFEEIERKAG